MNNQNTKQVIHFIQLLQNQYLINDILGSTCLHLTLEALPYLDVIARSVNMGSHAD